MLALLLSTRVAAQEEVPAWKGGPYPKQYVVDMEALRPVLVEGEPFDNEPTLEDRGRAGGSGCPPGSTSVCKWVPGYCVVAAAHRGQLLK